MLNWFIGLPVLKTTTVLEVGEKTCLSLKAVLLVIRQTKKCLYIYTQIGAATLDFLWKSEINHV